MTNHYSVEAEQAVIGGILINNHCANDVLEISPVSCFIDVRNLQIMTAIEQLAFVCQPIDIITLCEQIQKNGLKPDMGYIADIVDNTPSAASVRSYAAVVAEKASIRGFLSVLDDMAKAANERRYDTSEELIAALQGAINGLSVSDTGRIRGIKDILKSTIVDLDRRAKLEGRLDGLPTGLKNLDRHLKGMRDSDLIILGARPSQGKTALALQILIGASDVLKEKSSVGMVFSLEMSSEQLVERMASNVGRMPYSKLMNADYSTFSEFDPHINNAVAKIREMPIVIDDTGGLMVNQIVNRAMIQNSKNKVGFIVVDHLHIVRSEGQNREREVAKITAALKALAKNLSCPVLLLAQLNRKLEDRPDKRPRNADLRDSGSIEQDADVIMFLHREEVYNENTNRKGVAEIIFSKGRNIGTGTEFLLSRLDQMRFENYEGIPADEESKKENGSFSY